MYGNYINPYTNTTQRNIYPYYPNDNQSRVSPIQPIQPIQMNTPTMGLLGKSVDSIEVVKAMDIPLDGSVSYFPLTDGSAIVTKKLQSDGTSKTIIYRPVDEEKKEEKLAYVTYDDLDKRFEMLDISDLEDIKDLKDNLKNLQQELKDLKLQFKDKGGKK